MKYVNSACFFIGLVSACITVTLADVVIPERAEISYMDKKYFSFANLTVRRTGRKSPYYIHSVFKTIAWLGNNVTHHGLFYEFLHNEYKRSFVEISLNFWDVFNKEPWYSCFGKLLEARGLTCPLPPNTYKLDNISVSLINFPYVWPFEKGMMEWHAKSVPSQEIIFSGRFYISIKRAIPKGK